MGIRESVFPLLLVGAAGMFAPDAGLESSIGRGRMGTLVIRTEPGARITVPPFCSVDANGVFTGRARCTPITPFYCRYRTVPVLRNR
jgi:hypothetical protein